MSVFNAAGTLLTSGTADDGDYTLSLDGYTPVCILSLQVISRIKS